MVYIYMYIASTIFAYFAQRAKRKEVIIFCSIMCIMLPTLVGGLRGRVGNDVGTYAMPLYGAAISASSFMEYVQSSGIERGVLFLCYYGTKIFEHLNGSLLFYQLVTVTCFYIGIYKHRKIFYLPFAWLVFLFMHYNYTLTMMRQGMAGAVIFLGLDSLEEKKYFKFSLYVAAGTLFHYSAIIALPTLMGLHILATSDSFIKNYAYRMIVLLVFVSVLISIQPIMLMLVNSISFLAKYRGYLDLQEEVATGARRSWIVFYLAQFIMFLFYNRGAKKVFAADRGEYNTSFYNIHFLFMVIYELLSGIMSYRILIYSKYTDALVIAAFPSFVKNKYLRILVYFTTLCMIIIAWYFSNVMHGGSGTWPFRFFWQERW